MLVCQAFAAVIMLLASQIRIILLHVQPQPSRHRQFQFRYYLHELQHHLGLIIRQGLFQNRQKECRYRKYEKLNCNNIRESRP